MHQPPTSPCVAACIEHGTCIYHYSTTVVSSTDPSSPTRSLHCSWFKILIKGRSSSIATQPPSSTAVYHYCTTTVQCFSCSVARQSAHSLASGFPIVIKDLSSQSPSLVRLNCFTLRRRRPLLSPSYRQSRHFLHSWCQYTPAFPCSEVAARCSSLAAMRPSLIPSIIHGRLMDTSIV